MAGHLDTRLGAGALEYHIKAVWLAKLHKGGLYVVLCATQCVVGCLGVVDFW